MKSWLGAALAAVLLAVPAAAQADISVRPLEFDVTVGPERDQQCTVVADLYTPDGVGDGRRAPAVMATNGFGGSKNDFQKLGRSYAEHGYVFLAYSGLGFGGSGCRITLDDREHDGAAGSQLISFLGGTKAARDGTKIDYVKRDGPGDPRVGMIGGSYGGQVQFAIAAVDKRLDTIIPQITWNDLSYSLAPNNTDFAQGVTYATPGVVKIDWPVLFFGLGTGQGLSASLADPSHVSQCPNFADAVCPSLIQGAARGYLDEGGIELLRNASVSSYYDAIDIPVFLTQGQSDNLFNLNESVATYEALRSRGVPVKLLWRSAGHSGGGLGTAESNPTDLEAAYESRMYLAWFDHYLKGSAPKPRHDFSFLTDWIEYEGDAAPAVGVTAKYPAGTDTPFYLSGSDDLTPDAKAVEEGSATIASSAAPTSSGGGVVDAPQTDAAGTAASWTTAPFDAPLDVAGVPSVRLHVQAPTFAATVDPAQLLILHAKLYDVSPEGQPKLVRNQISAARIGDPAKPVRIDLPGQVHRYGRGHSLRLTVATSAASYRGGLGAGPVTLQTSPEQPAVLTIPRLGAIAGPVGSGPFGTTPFAGRAFQLPAARLPRRCARTLRFRLESPRTLRVARIAVNGRRVRTITGGKLRRPVTLRLPAGRARVVVTARSKSGVKRRSARTYSC